METNVLYNQDCLKGMLEIPTESIDLVVTDCPYHIAPHGTSFGGGIFSDKKNEYVNSGKLFAHNDIAFSEWLPDVYRVLKQCTHCYIMVNARNLKELQVEAEKVGFIFQNILVWKKENSTPNKYYMNQLEFILMLRKGAAKYVNDMGITNCLSCPNIIGKGAKGEHPCLPAGEKVFVNGEWVNIEQVKAGDKSNYGIVEYVSSHYANRFVEIQTQNGIVVATWNHPFLIVRGNEIAWCQADKITNNDFILWNNKAKPLNLQPKGMLDLTAMGNNECSITLFGKVILEKFQRVTKYLISMGTKQTITLQTCNLLLPLNTNGYTKVANLSSESGTSRVGVVGSLRKLIKRIGILTNTDGLREMECANLAISKNHSQCVRLSLQKVGSVKILRKRRKVFNLSIKGVPAFDTMIGVSHNTAKPVPLMELLIKQSSNVGDIVLDPFAGGGSTLVAAKRCERQYIGFEIDEKYYNTAINRLTVEPQQASLF